MGQHSTDEVYDKLADVELKLDSNSKNTVSTSHFDGKIRDLKEAIQNGKKKDEDEQKSFKDIIKDMSPIKEFLAVANGTDFLGKLALLVTAFGASVALVVGIVSKVKELTLAITGRTRNYGLFGDVIPENQRVRRSFGRAEDGSWGLQPEEQTDVRQPRLPSVEEVGRVKDAIGLLNTEIGTYREKVRGLATPRAMRQMASAAKKLESAAKNHQSVDTLAGSIRELNAEMRVLAGTAGS
ncbi:hypothetical protein ACIPX0_22730 [Streptomyces sp. NPDC090075]|uniref:hypothetical protein n=1 Tax=unclassified Streptomyces TaxID=2593676 RepID=UPI0033F38AF7